MAPNHTKPDFKKSSIQSAGSISSGKGKGSPSNSKEHSSKGSTREKRTRVPETDSASKDSASLSKLDVKPVAQESAIHQYRDTSVHESAEFDPIGKGATGPRSASSTGSQPDQKHPQQTVFSLDSSWITDMSEATEYSGASEALYRKRRQENPALGLRFQAKEEFSPGKIVALECFDEEPLVHDGNGPLLSPEQFLKMEDARTMKIKRVAIFRTYLNYSMAVRIHTHNLAESAELNPHQAIIYTKALAPPDDTSSPPINTAIQVEGCSPEMLPRGSRIDYSDVCVVEHNEPVAFLGEIIRSCRSVFAETYQRVQKTLGRTVERPTMEPESCSDQASSTGTGAPPASLTNVPLDSGECMPQLSREQRGRPPPVDRSSPPPFGGPSSPDSHTSKARTRSAERISSEQHAPANTGWSRFTSENPRDKLRLSDLARTRTEPIMQNKYRPPSAGYYMVGCAGMGVGNKSMHISQSVLAYESRDEANTTAETIANTRQWIKDAVEHREQLRRRIVQPNQTVEALCTFKGVPEHLFTASRVRVAILDSEVDVDSAVFAPYRARIKDYEDFRAPGPRPIPQLSTHGMDVTSLFLHMAPDADVFVAQAFDDRVSLIKAIYHAVRTWKVDIISISGGGFHESDVGIRKALNYAHYSNVRVFAATHNEGKSHAISYPARAQTVYPVFSTNYKGEACENTNPDPLPNTINLSTLGESIPPFWMEPYFQKFPDLVYQIKKGSSFAAPIAVGICASTLLFARLTYTGEPRLPVPDVSRDKAVMDAIMEMLSDLTPCGKYRYVLPTDLWTDGDAAAKIKQKVWAACKLVAERKAAEAAATAAKGKAATRSQRAPVY